MRLPMGSNYLLLRQRSTVESPSELRSTLFPDTRLFEQFNNVRKTSIKNNKKTGGLHRSLRTLPASDCGPFLHGHWSAHVTARGGRSGPLPWQQAGLPSRVPRRRASALRCLFFFWWLRYVRLGCASHHRLSRSSKGSASNSSASGCSHGCSSGCRTAPGTGRTSCGRRSAPCCLPRNLREATIYSI